MKILMVIWGRFSIISDFCWPLHIIEKLQNIAKNIFQTNQHILNYIQFGKVDQQSLFFILYFTVDGQKKI